MKIVCDENMPAIDELFGQFGEIKALPGRTMSASDLQGADVLLVRSVTKVNEVLLSQANNLKMVGTATIGMDHIDRDLLQQRGVPFFNAPGCNAEAVVDYDLSAITLILNEQKRSIEDLTVGIIGVGNVGGRLAKRLQHAGVNLLLNDPPRALHESEPENEFVDLEHLLSEADIICCHTPLVTEGEWPSLHLIDANKLRLIKAGAILLNAGRGPVIDSNALKAFLQRPNTDVTVVLDVWENEPCVEKELADLVHIATPHIAGYSLDGKLRGSYMLYQAFCRTFGIKEEICLTDIQPQADLSLVNVTNSIALHDLMRWVYDPFRDDRALRATLTKDNQPEHFDLLRKSYPKRREFSSLQVAGVSSSNLCKNISALGFALA